MFGMRFILKLMFINFKSILLLFQRLFSLDHYFGEVLGILVAANDKLI